MSNLIIRLVAFEALLLVFGGFTVYAIVTQGYSAFIALAITLFQSVWGVQLLVDFALAIGMLLYWMSADAKARGITFGPFIPLTLTLGSIGPIGYFAWREWKVWLEGRSGVMAERPSHQRA